MMVALRTLVSAMTVLSGVDCGGCARYESILYSEITPFGRSGGVQVTLTVLPPGSGINCVGAWRPAGAVWERKQSEIQVFQG